VSYNPRNFLAGRATNVNKLPIYCCFSQMMRLPEDDLVIIAVGNVQATPAIDEVLEQLFRLCRSLPYRDP